ncbi:MAG: SLC5 family protein, partial [Pseudomonadota bacterium]
VAAGIRLLIVPVIVVVPGIVSYKMFGDVGDPAYGMIVAEVLPLWLSGAFAAAIFAAVLTTFNSILNASAALYVCDIHEAYVGDPQKVGRLGAIVSIVMSVLALALVPFFASQESLINTVQELYGLLSMPILSAFVVGLAFRNVKAGAAIIGVLTGVAFYGFWSMVWEPAHYIHGMAVTLVLAIVTSLAANLVIFGQRAELAIGQSSEPDPAAA